MVLTTGTELLIVVTRVTSSIFAVFFGGAAGGVIHVDRGGAVTVTNSLFENNTVCVCDVLLATS